MDIELLINQIDEHNESSILATKNINPKKFYFYMKKNMKELWII